jgi:hypothetical protein
MTDIQQGARDPHGRWCRGVSGNPAGRPRGSKNRRPRRRADPERATEWTGQDWRVFYQLNYRNCSGRPARCGA